MDLAGLLGVSRTRPGDALMPSDDDVTDWPTIRTARQLVEAEIVPCSETTLKARTNAEMAEMLERLALEEPHEG